MAFSSFLFTNTINPRESVPEVLSARGNKARAPGPTLLCPHPGQACLRGRKKTQSPLQVLAPKARAIPGTVSESHRLGMGGTLSGTSSPSCQIKRLCVSLGALSKGPPQLSLKSGLNHLPALGSAILLPILRENRKIWVPYDKSSHKSHQKLCPAKQLPCGFPMTGLLCEPSLHPGNTDRQTYACCHSVQPQSFKIHALGEPKPTCVSVL